MPFHLCKLLPPRPTFPADMTAEEAGLMQEHVAYWQRAADRGAAVIVGPVFDPAGIWGLAIVDVSDAAEASDLTETGSADPLGPRLPLRNSSDSAGDPADDPPTQPSLRGAVPKA